jgi:hypothetical protein
MHTALTKQDLRKCQSEHDLNVLLQIVRKHAVPNKPRLRKFVKNLRSAVQCRGHLRDSAGRFCADGVLADATELGSWHMTVDYAINLAYGTLGDVSVVGYIGFHGEIADEIVLLWYGLTSPIMLGEGTSLHSANDCTYYWTLSEIADAVERKFGL